MNHSDFRVGLAFWSIGRQWRCTDVGSRTVIAIRIDAVTVETLDDGQVGRRTIGRIEAEATGWFSGPPYGVAEVVFDENDLEGCRLERDEP